MPSCNTNRSLHVWGARGDSWSCRDAKSGAATRAAEGCSNTTGDLCLAQRSRQHHLALDALRDLLHWGKTAVHCSGIACSPPGRSRRLAPRRSLSALRGGGLPPAQGPRAHMQPLCDTQPLWTDLVAAHCQSCSATACLACIAKQVIECANAQGTIARLACACAGAVASFAHAAL